MTIGGLGRRVVTSLGIRYAVVTDNDCQTRNAYKVEAWPTTLCSISKGNNEFEKQVET
jgi:hypothetical protein